MRAAAGSDPEDIKVEDESAATKSREAAEGALSLETFDLERVLQMGTPLLASGGQVRDSLTPTPTYISM